MRPNHPISGSSSVFKRFRHSVFPNPLLPRTENDRKRWFFHHLVFHFRPATVPAKTLRLKLTWGLGGMAVMLVLMQFASGMLLKFVYEPTPQAAYTSVRMLAEGVPFGRLVRNLHHWCAHLLVPVVFLHMLRVFFTGAFHPPRQFNWIIGLGLFGTVLAANFTGYLLPWDQLAFWAVTVSAGMLEYVPWAGRRLRDILAAGNDLGPGTLRLFFAVHTAVVPVVLFTLMGFHFWRIRKSGGLVIPRLPGETGGTQPERVPTLPHLLVREVVAGMTLVAVIMMLSVFFDAPLGDPANPGLSPNPTKAPWYFAGLQEVLLHFHPVFAVCILPLAVGAALLSIPYLRYESPPDGIWFVSPKGKRMAVGAVALALASVPPFILISEWGMPPGALVSGLSPVIGNGLLPFVLSVVVLMVCWAFIRRRFSATVSESVQTLFVLLVSIFVLLTATSMWFRGKGMALTIPW